VRTRIFAVETARGAVIASGNAETIVRMVSLTYAPGAKPDIGTRPAMVSMMARMPPVTRSIRASVGLVTLTRGPAAILVILVLVKTGDANDHGVKARWQSLPEGSSCNLKRLRTSDAEELRMKCLRPQHTAVSVYTSSKTSKIAAAMMPTLMSGQRLVTV